MDEPYCLYILHHPVTKGILACFKSIDTGSSPKCDGSVESPRQSKTDYEAAGLQKDDEEASS
jgi:hypothetical protein